MKITGFILLTLAIIVAGGLWYWNTHKKKIIRDQLEKAIQKKSQGLYKIHYDNLELDEVNGHLSLTSFHVNYDSTRFVQLQKENKEPFILFNISIPEIRIIGVETPRALIDKEISGRHLDIINPVIEILYTGKDSSRNIPDKEIYQQILGNLDLIKLDSVIISGAEIITKDLKTGKTSVHFFNTSVSLLDVRVDSSAEADTTRLLFAKEINVDCEKFTWQSKSQLYSYQVDSLSLRSASSNVSLKNFFILPQLKEDAFARRARVQTDRFDFAIRNIQLKNIDYYQLINESIKADSLFIGSASFKIYRDRSMPEDKQNKVGMYPHQLIQKIPVPLEIKTAIVHNAYIEYKERSPITNQSGKVQLWNSSAWISNVTNRKERIADNNLMVCDMHSRLLNKVPLSVKWTFYLGNPNGKFAISGKAGAADATIFNVLSVPMGPAMFKSGHINSLEFDLTGSDYKIQGKVKLLYNDFHLTLLKKDEDSIHFEKRKLVSFLANMKIKNNNPDGDKPARVANINMDRDVSRSIFNLAWKTLFEGIKEITGAK